MRRLHQRREFSGRNQSFVWLCSYAGEGEASKDIALTECAEEMLCEFIGAVKGSSLSDIAIRKQYKNIDVLILLGIYDAAYTTYIDLMDAIKKAAKKYTKLIGAFRYI